MKETIFFIEDDKSIHALIKATLEMNDYEVEGFTDPLVFLEAIKDKIPDLLVLDLMLPNMSGYELMNILHSDERYSKIPVIILSALSDELDIVMGLEHGAVDYISKPFGVLEFASRIKSCLQKFKPEGEKVIRVRGLVVDVDRHECTVDGQLLTLTAKEFKLLYLLAKHSPKVLTREILLREVWGYSTDVETRTLDMHVRSVREKMSRITSEQYVVTVRSVGFVIYGKE